MLAAEVTMTMQFIKLATAVLWAGVALSSAAPAHAWATTTQVGQFATCNNSYSVTHLQCVLEGLQTYTFSYVQNIKFHSTPNCNSGGCASEPGTVYVTSLYANGRKTATLEDFCTGKRLYSLGVCAC